MSGGGAAEQVGHDPGIGLQRADLAVAPVPTLGREQIDAPNRPPLGTHAPLPRPPRPPAWTAGAAAISGLGGAFAATQQSARPTTTGPDPCPVVLNEDGNPFCGARLTALPASPVRASAAPRPDRVGGP